MGLPANTRQLRLVHQVYIYYRHHTCMCLPLATLPFPGSLEFTNFVLRFVRGSSGSGGIVCSNIFPQLHSDVSTSLYMTNARLDIDSASNPCNPDCGKQTSTLDYCQKPSVHCKGRSISNFLIVFSGVNFILAKLINGYARRYRQVIQVLSFIATH